MNPQVSPNPPGGSDNDPTILGNTPMYNSPIAATPFTPAVNPEQPTPRPGQPAGWGPPPLNRESASTQIIPSFRSPPAFAWFVVIEAPDQRLVGEIFKVNVGVTGIGRTTGNDIVLPDVACSSQHARVRVEEQEGGEKRFVLHDLASTNGTYVGDKDSYREDSSRVYHRALQDGDYVLIGETTLVFKRI
ncbi:FHA domain-containing protein [Candidatus Amarolinea aalborgensis]|jgi:hypothetical protein|uniref:FHA domain-containing protein n=1 Tax=Candidatus Amarolinea aalborgensis TaxID=2249329 RepID=UPI003BF9964C